MANEEQLASDPPPSSPALRAGHPPLLRNRFGESRAWLSGVCAMANTLKINNGIL